MHAGRGDGGSHLLGALLSRLPLHHLPHHTVEPRRALVLRPGQHHTQVADHLLGVASQPKPKPPLVVRT